MDGFTIESHVDYPAFRKAWMRLSFRRPASLVFALISLAFATACVWDLLTRDAEWWWMGLMAPLPLGFVIFFGSKRSLDYVKANPNRLERTHATFTEGGVQLNGNFFSDHFPWINVEVAREFPDQWAFITDEQEMFVFEKRGFSAEENAALRERIRRL